MQESTRIQLLRAKRYEFDKYLGLLQELLLEIHKYGGKDVIVYQQVGTESEIYRETREL